MWSQTACFFFFLIHWLYMQENCTRWTVPFLLSAHVNGTEQKLLHARKRSPWSYTNRSEEHCPTLPLLSLFRFLFKVSCESKPQQSVPSLAQVAYFYPAVSILTSLFSIDQWLSPNLSLLQQSSLQIELCLHQWHPWVRHQTCSWFVFILMVTFSSLERSWEKFSGKKPLCTFTSEGLSWHDNCSLTQTPHAEQNQWVHTQFFSGPFPYKFSCLEF